MTHGSLFTGIGGFDLGFEKAGIKTLWQVEQDKSCQKVLTRHWPNIKRYEDVKEVGKRNLETVDIISGGFPCQDVSVAGKRGGLQAPRSGLFYETERIIKELKPAWFVLENVPGLFSSNKGEDFKIIIKTLTNIGYGVCWRVLDSQYFGVAQRRRRVFIIGHAGNASAAKVLFESESMYWNPQAGSKARSGTPKGVARSITSSCYKRHDEDTDTIIPVAFTENQRGEVWTTPYAQQLTAGGGKPGQGYPAIMCSSLDPNGMRNATRFSKRLDYPLLPKGLDSQRYKALGNAVTVNVVEWIGRNLVKANETI